jgi:hypothetical protein
MDNELRLVQVSKRTFRIRARGAVDRSVAREQVERFALRTPRSSWFDGASRLATGAQPECDLARPTVP